MKHFTFELTARVVVFDGSEDSARRQLDQLVGDLTAISGMEVYFQSAAIHRADLTDVYDPELDD